MEEALLENSKGATYMSFILDVEILIKQDGTRTNLAESKAKVPKKEKETDKKPYGSSRNEDVKVYAMSQAPTKNIFELPLRSKTSKKPSHSTENYRPERVSITSQNKPDIETLVKEKNDSKHSEYSSDKENIFHTNIQPQIQNTTTSSASLDESSTPPNKKLTKRRKSVKKDRKDKVLKGKVEPIDFLECNRIFMCNYFKIPRYRRNKSNSSYSNSETDFCKHDSQINTPKCLSSPNIQTKKPLNVRKRSKFWKSSNIDVSYSLSENCAYDQDFTSGDFKTKTDVNENHSETITLKTQKINRNLLSYKFGAKQDGQQGENDCFTESVADTTIYFHKNNISLFKDTDYLPCSNRSCECPFNKPVIENITDSESLTKVNTNSYQRNAFGEVEYSDTNISKMDKPQQIESMDQNQEKRLCNLKIHFSGDGENKKLQREPEVKSNIETLHENNKEKTRANNKIVLFNKDKYFSSNGLNVEESTQNKRHHSKRSLLHVFRRKTNLQLGKNVESLNSHKVEGQSKHFWQRLNNFIYLLTKFEE